MKLFGFEIVRASEKRALLDQVLALRQANAGYGGASVNAQSAMGITAVWACVNKISKTVATLPWGAMIRGPNEERLTAVNEPLHRILALRPNDYQTPNVFRRQAMAHLLLWGNFFAEIQRDRRTDDPIGLYPVHPSEVSVELKGGRKSYRMKGQPFLDDDVFHIMGHSIDGIRGVSPLAVHRATFATSIEQQRFSEYFYRNGVRLSGSLEHPKSLSKEAQANIRSSFEEQHAGAANTNSVLVLEEGMKFNPMSMPLADAQFVETLRLSIADAARIYDMPMHKLAEMDGAKFNNVEQQNIGYVVDCIQPIVTAWEQEANWKLVHPDERVRLYTKFNLAAMLRGDFKTRMAGYAQMRQWALATIDEIRALEDWSPLPDGLGSNPFIGGNAQASALATDDTADEPKTEETNA